LSFNTEKILFYYRTFQVHIPEGMGKNSPKKLYTDAKETQKLQVLQSDEDQVQHHEQK
jgi:hypothetical protein